MFRLDESCLDYPRYIPTAHNGLRTNDHYKVPFLAIAMKVMKRHNLNTLVKYVVTVIGTNTWRELV